MTSKSFVQNLRPLGATRTHLGGNVNITASDVSLSTDSDNFAVNAATNYEVSVLEVDVEKRPVNTDHNNEAYVGTDANVSVIGGALTLDAIATRNVAQANQFEQELAILGVSVGRLDARVDGSTRAYIADGATVAGEQGVAINALSEDNVADARIESVALNGIAVDSTRSTAVNDHLVEAIVYPTANVTAVGGTVSLDARSKNLAKAGVIATNYSIADVNVLTARSETTGDTLAQMLGNVRIAGNNGQGNVVADQAGAQNVIVNAYGDNLATTHAQSFGASVIGVDVLESSAVSQPLVSARFGSGTINASHNVSLVAESHSDADAVVWGQSTNLLFSIGVNESAVRSTPTVNASVGHDANITAGNLIRVQAVHGIDHGNVDVDDIDAGETTGDGIHPDELSTTRNNIVSASATGIQQSLILEVGVANASAKSNPDVRTEIGSAARLSGRDVIVDATSASSAISYGSSRARAIGIAVGRSSATVDIDNTVNTVVADSAMITAIDDVSITSSSNESGFVQAGTNGGAILYSGARATADAFLDYESIATVNGTINAGGDLKVESEVDGSRPRLGVCSSPRIAGNAKCEHERSKRQPPGDGIRIGDSVANVHTILSPNANLTGRDVELAARVDGIVAEAYAEADADAGGANSDALAGVDVVDEALVRLDSFAEVKGETVSNPC